MVSAPSARKTVCALGALASGASGRSTRSLGLVSVAQYVPSVSESDIERIVQRDYSSDLQAVIHEMIRGIEVREKPRVIMACLKNANGNFEKLKGELTNASGWWREIIGEAEYPNYTKKMFRIDRLSADEKERIIEKDKTQYLAWLRRRGSGEKNEA